MPPKNPWKNISWQNTIANVDKCHVAPFFVGMGKSATQQLHNALLPEPFHGDLNANVYLLNGNPGFSDKDYKLIGDKTIESHIQDTLTQKPAHVPMMWLDSNFNGNPAYKWWTQKLKNITLHKPNPKICVIEYIPYHSKSLPSLPPLPSDAFVDWWIRDAMLKDKWIIIMRCKKQWLNRIPQLTAYPKLLECTNPQNPVVSSSNLIYSATGNNISPSVWNKILSLL